MTTLVPTLDQLDAPIRDAVLATVARKADEVGINPSLVALTGRIAGLLLDVESEAQLVEDGDWYGRAHELATAWAGAFNLPVHVVAGVLAITSPQTSWTRNRQDAHVILTAEHQYPVVSTPILAERILDARHNGGALTVQPRRVLENALQMIRTFNVDAYLGKGPKVRSFYSNIVDPVGSTDVTVDTHMLRAMLGDPELDASGPTYKATLACKAPQRKADGYTDGLYPYFAQAIVDAARMARLRPNQAQAIAWCQWRRAQGAWGGTVDRDPVYLSPSTIAVILAVLAE